jgi:hypothetical protein
VTATFPRSAMSAHCQVPGRSAYFWVVLPIAA